MQRKNRRKIAVRYTAAVVLAAGLFLLAACAEKLEPENEVVSETGNVSTMDGYVSVYHPAHLDSSEAWNLAQTEDAVILDIQSEESYLERHVSGAVNVSLDELTDYAAENLPEKDQVIICYCFCGDTGGSALAAYEMLTELGYTHVVYTEPEDEWSYEGTPVFPADEVGTLVIGVEAKTLYEQNAGAILLDVRNDDEYQEKHIQDSILIPVDELEARLSELPDKEAVIIVYCKAGGRSKRACEILADAGYSRVYDMQAVDAWPLELVVS